MSRAWFTYAFTNAARMLHIPITSKVYKFWPWLICFFCANQTCFTYALHALPFRICISTSSSGFYRRKLWSVIQLMYEHVFSLQLFGAHAPNMSSAHDTPKHARTHEFEFWSLTYTQNKHFFGKSTCVWKKNNVPFFSHVSMRRFMCANDYGYVTYDRRVM